jgi:hypothetical protein
MYIDDTHLGNENIVFDVGQKKISIVPTQIDIKVFFVWTITNIQTHCIKGMEHLKIDF